MITQTNPKKNIQYAVYINAANPTVRSEVCQCKGDYTGDGTDTVCMRRYFAHAMELRLPPFPMRFEFFYVDLLLDTYQLLDAMTVINYWTRLSLCLRHRQIIDLPSTDKSRYFARTEFNNCFIICIHLQSFVLSFFNLIIRHCNYEHVQLIFRKFSKASRHCLQRLKAMSMLRALFAAMQLFYQMRMLRLLFVGQYFAGKLTNQSNQKNTLK